MESGTVTAETTATGESDVITQSETNTAETPATGKSLLKLIPVVWEKACKLLPLRDLASLHSIHPTATFLRTVLAKRRVAFDTARVQCLEVDGYKLTCGETDGLAAHRLELLQQLGPLLGKVRFNVNILELDDDTFACIMNRLAAKSSALSSLTLNAVSYGTFFFKTEYEVKSENWLTVIRQCLSERPDREVGIRVVTDDPTQVLFMLAAQMPPTDPRFMFATRLTIISSSHAFSRSLLSSSVTEFICKFTYLTKLSLGTFLSALMMDSIAQTHSSLEVLQITCREDGLKETINTISTEAWNSLTESLPSLRVKCYVSFCKDLDKVYDVLTKLFRPETPLSEMHIFGYGGEINSRWQQWFEQFKAPLELISVAGEKKDDGSIDSFKTLLYPAKN